jgi:OmpA-OmpF porin, OOP family
MLAKGELMLTRKAILKFTVALAIVFLMTMGATGCASKKYVKQQIDPLTGKVAEVEAISKKNAQDIRDVDGRAQAGIQAANEKAEAADAKAVAAGQKADAVGANLNQVAGNIKGVQTELDSRIGNLDNYKLTDSAEVNFRSGKYDLNDEAKANLDAIAAKVKDQKGYVFEIQGFTDSRGAEGLNLDLSQKRAESVQRYLATTHNVPLFRLSIIGVGKEKPVEDNKTKEGRARNRRVEIRLLRTTV